MSETDNFSVIPSSSSGLANSSLSGLPTDVLIEIATSCSPLDIISIRRTCKSLSEASRHRTIWIAVVRRVCSQQDIAAAAYPVEEFTIIQLEQVAIAPWRIMDLFMTPSSKQPIQPVEIYKGKRGLKQGHLVSGGRFLLTISTSKMLQLWDLGFVWDTRPDWQLLASVQQRSEFVFCVDALPASDGTGLHVILKETRLPLYEVYEVDPWSPAPQFHLKGTLSLDGLISDNNSFSCARGMYIVHCDRGPVLWNWEQDSWIQFPFNKFVLKSGACKTHVVLLHSTHLSLWAIPDDLPRRVAGQSVPVANFEPLTCIPFPGSLALSHFVWHKAPSMLHLDIVYDNSFGLHLHQFSFTMDGRQVSRDDWSSDSHSSRHSNLWRPSRMDLLIERIFWIHPADSFVVVWKQLFEPDLWNGKTHGQLVVRSEETGVFNAQRLVDLTPVFGSANLCRLSFDQFSGRACALLTGDHVVTMDYLEVPNENSYHNG